MFEHPTKTAAASGHAPLDLVHDPDSYRKDMLGRRVPVPLRTPSNLHSPPMRWHGTNPKFLEPLPARWGSIEWCCSAIATEFGASHLHNEDRSVCFRPTACGRSSPASPRCLGAL